MNEIMFNLHTNCRKMNSQFISIN